MALSPAVAHRIEFPTFLVAAPGSAEPFPNIHIPDGFSVTLKNRARSRGNFYLASTKADAESLAGRRMVLEPGDAVTLAIDNLSLLWRDADDALSRLEVTLAQAFVA